MKSKIRNDLAVTVDGVDLTTISKPEFYVRQANKFFQYTPEIVDEKTMVVRIPFEDTMQLTPKKIVNGLKSPPCMVQFAFTRENGTPDYSEKLEVDVEDLLKTEGYQ
jgi:hypothetical protein|nr:MAG TPA: hypothetical protein [Caudoviricetes sp.]